MVASDSPYPEPLHSARPLPDHFGLALLLTPMATERSIASLTIGLGAAQPPAEALQNASLDALRRAIPAAAGLPLLAALAQGAPRQGLVLDYLPKVGLRVDVLPP